MSSHICSTQHEKKKKKTRHARGLEAAHSVAQSTFLCLKCLKSLGWVRCSLCYNISIWGQDECVPFFIFSHSSPLLSPPPAESRCLGGKTWLEWCTNPGDIVGGPACTFHVCFLCVWWIAFTFRTVVVQIHPVSYYTQGHAGKETLCLNDSSYFNQSLGK